MPGPSSPGTSLCNHRSTSYVRGANLCALSAADLHYPSVLLAVVKHMIRAAVFAIVVLHRNIGVRTRNLVEALVAGKLRHRLEELEVHHVVRYHKKVPSLRYLAPAADEPERLV